MIKNVTFLYPNQEAIPVKELCSYQFNNLNKTFLLYTLGEMEGTNEVIYFGEIKKDNEQFEMNNVQSQDLDEFRKLLMAFAGGTFSASASNYTSADTLLEGHTVIVKGGGRTKLNSAILDPYFHSITIEEKEEIEELDFGDVLESEPATIAEATPVQPQVTVTEPVITKVPEVQATPLEPVVVSEVQTVATPTAAPAVAVAPQSPVTEAPKEQPMTSVSEPVTVPETQPEASKKETKKKQKKGSAFLIIFLLIVLLSIAGVAGYFWIKENNRKADEKESASESTSEISVTLDQIARKLKSSSLLSELEEEYGTVLSSTTSKAIKIQIQGLETYEYQYSQKKDYLETIVSTDDELGHVLSQYVYASIQELLGNDRVEALNAIQSGFENPSLDIEGYSISTKDTNDTIQLSLVTKIDLTEVSLQGPIELELFESQGEALTTVDSLSLEYGNLSFEKYGEGNSRTVIIAEKSDLTEDAYQTFIHYLTAAYGSVKSNDFSDNYPSFTDADSSNGYEIVLDGELPDAYSSKYTSDVYHWVAITFEV